MSSFWLVILSYRYQHCRKQLCSYCSSLLTLVRRKIIREHLPSFSKGKHQTRLFVRESEATWFQVVHLYQTGAQVPLKSAYPEGKKNWHSVLSAGALCILTNLGAELDRLCLLSACEFVHIHVASELEFLTVTTFSFWVGEGGSKCRLCSFKKISFCRNGSVWMTVYGWLLLWALLSTQVHPH